MLAKTKASENAMSAQNISSMIIKPIGSPNILNGVKNSQKRKHSINIRRPKRKVFGRIPPGQF